MRGGTMRTVLLLGVLVLAGCHPRTYEHHHLVREEPAVLLPDGTRISFSLWANGSGTHSGGPWSLVMTMSTQSRGPVRTVVVSDVILSHRGETHSGESTTCAARFFEQCPVVPRYDAPVAREGDRVTLEAIVDGIPITCTFRSTYVSGWAVFNPLLDIT